MGVENLDKLIEDCSNSLNAKNNSLSNLLTVFGKLISTKDYYLDNNNTDDYVKECQFAIVYKYISDEKKSDRLTFKNNSNTNAKATDFVNGLDKYLRNICQSIINSYSEEAAPQDVSHIRSLSNELKMIRSKSCDSLAQSLSTKILERYDTSKALITAIHDALKRGVPVRTLGELFAGTYAVQGKARAYGGVIPKYKEYMDRQKAINTVGK